MRILIFGANGQVGWELQRSLAPIGELSACDRRKANFHNLDTLREVVRKHEPDVIVNAAAYTAVDRAEEEAETAKIVNSDAVTVLAEEAKASNALLIHYSTDYVFDGLKKSAYDETDGPRPLNVYGKTKLDGEVGIRECDCDHLIFRTGWVYAERGRNFINTILRAARELDVLSVVSDQFGAPTHAELIGDVTAHALHQWVFRRSDEHIDLKGTYHLTAAGETNWHEYACYVLSLAKRAGFPLIAQPERIAAIPSEAHKVAATRPKNSRLNCEKLENTFNLRLPHWKYQVARSIEMIVKRMR